MRLTRDFFARPAQEVARELLGATLVRSFPDGRQATGRIVEVEAYIGPKDRACHAFRGRRTARTEVIFGPPGRAYVFLVYGMHHCLNVVTDPAGFPAAVLLRAIAPLDLDDRAGEALLPRAERLGARGPGRLCRALGIDRSFNGADFCAQEEDGRAEAAGPEHSKPTGLHFEAGTPPARIRATARIGVDYAGSWARRRLRFHEADNPWVSGPAI